ncbi:hypothetical protein [Corynebacterium simulans]|uniref:hypothetical protein n=1 Tax=Corynebacterium simulans TaxID=146827 RepID=UPI002002CB4E|nr:hypothetical protein [Corynebacterium simulans]MCK6160080.1 hypothetical protein [Corynebacterium simulans]
MHSGFIVVCGLILCVGTILGKEAARNWADYHAARPLCEREVLKQAKIPERAMFLTETIPETDSKISAPMRVYTAHGEVIFINDEGVEDEGTYDCLVSFRTHSFVTSRAEVSGIAPAALVEAS